MMYDIQIKAVVGYQRYGWVSLGKELTLSEAGKFAEQLQKLGIECRAIEVVCN